LRAARAVADVYDATISAHVALNGDIDDAKFWVAEHHELIKETVQ
tara:strand:+ start:386 stop:520 length:135 start_codon:yes stop_codon:yes gene_type:complete